MDNSTKDSFLELEKSLAEKAAKERAKKLKKILIPIIIISILTIVVVVIIFVLRPSDNKGEDTDDKYNGTIKAKYIINDYSKKIKIINAPVDKISISVFVNNTKIIDLKENEYEISLDKTYGNNLELKYKGKLTNLSYLFNQMDNLEEIDLSGINAKEVNSMENMFSNCYNLKYANFSNLVITNLKNINNMFYNCSNLEIIDLENIDTKNILTSKSTFEKCTKLTKINIKEFDLTKITDASYMFANCDNLREINLKNDGAQSNPIDIKSIFTGLVIFLYKK